MDPRVTQGSPPRRTTLGWKAQRRWRKAVLALAIAFLLIDQRSPAQTPLFAPPAAPVANVAAAPPAEQVPPTAPTSPVEPTPPDEMLLESPRPRAMEAGQVIARVNGEVVLACEVMWMANVELEHRLGTLPAEQRAQIPADQLQAVREALMRQLLLGVVDRKIKYTDFRRNAPMADLKLIHGNLDTHFDDKEIPRLLKAFKAQNAQDLEVKLHAVGTSLREQREMFYEQMIGHSWIREQVKVDETVTHEDMLAYYQQHLAENEFPTQVRWEELMIRIDRCPGANWEERKASAYRQVAELGNQLWQRVQATPPAEQAFADVAKTHSHGATSTDGGLHDWTTQGALRATTINDAIFSLAPGQMSDNILATDDGFHIVRVLERKDAGRTPFTEVQAAITEKVVDQRFNAAAKEKIDTIRAEARIWTVYTGQTTATALFTRPSDTVRK
ncbi:MAG: peptidylprolyl isomerase [Pirellulales bacterium]